MNRAHALLTRGDIVVEYRTSVRDVPGSIPTATVPCRVHMMDPSRLTNC